MTMWTSSEVEMLDIRGSEDEDNRKVGILLAI